MTLIGHSKPDTFRRAWWFLRTVAFGDRKDLFAFHAPFACPKGRQKAHEMQICKIQIEAVPLSERDYCTYRKKLPGRRRRPFSRTTIDSGGERDEKLSRANA